MSLTSVNFTVNGEPVPQSRPRFTKQGHSFKAPKSREYENKVRDVARLVMQKNSPMRGQLRITVDFFMTIPKGMPKWVVPLATGKMVRPTKKPDTSNLLKAVEDGMNGIVYIDDSQVVEVVANKFYSNHPRADISIEVIGYDINQLKEERNGKRRESETKKT